MAHTMGQSHFFSPPFEAAMPPRMPRAHSLASVPKIVTSAIEKMPVSTPASVSVMPIDTAYLGSVGMVM